MNPKFIQYDGIMVEQGHFKEFDYGDLSWQATMISTKAASVFRPTT